MLKKDENNNNNNNNILSIPALPIESLFKTLYNNLLYFPDTFLNIINDSFGVLDQNNQLANSGALYYIYKSISAFS